MKVAYSNTSRAQQGFALITTILLLLLVSGLAAAVMYMSMTQKSISKSDTEDSIVYYGAEAGMEKMMSDLALLYQSKQAPSLSDLASLSSQAPDIPGVKYEANAVSNAYSITAPEDPVKRGFPASYQSNVASGDHSGLIAQIIPINLTATASRMWASSANSNGATQIRMFRKVEVALIPVFQFGVFCDADCSYFPGPNFDFAGRVHTNGNLWLAAGSSLTFHDKITAVGDVIRKQLANTYDATSGAYNGTVSIPTATGGCDGSKPACRTMSFCEGSVTGGSRVSSAPNYDSSSTLNRDWVTAGGSVCGPSGSPAISTGTYHSFILSGDTGATALKLPFVSSGVQPIEIIRRKKADDGSTPGLGNSRLMNEASIRILLDDNPYNLSTLGPLDPQNIALENTGNLVSPGLSSVVNAVTGGAQYFATGTDAAGIRCNTNVSSSCTSSAQVADTNWIPPANGVDPYVAAKYYTGATLPSSQAASVVPWTSGTTTVRNVAGATATIWPLLTGWIRIEVGSSAGGYTAVTTDVLQWGWSRQADVVPNSETGITNTVNPNAIVLLQQIFDLDAKGAASKYTTTGTMTGLTGLNTSGFNYYPINFYDPREGELRDTTSGKAGGSCSINGIMNAVEIDVGNLTKWLTGAAPYGSGSKGALADSNTFNGYILYFSDRRGGSVDGGYDYLDTINSGTSNGMPNGALDKEEDVYLGTYPSGINSTVLVTPPAYIGSGFGVTPKLSSTNFNPGVGTRVQCSTNGSAPFGAIGRANVVLAPRHVLRLVNGTLGNLPGKKADGTGGFTVASEQPVYIMGNYNASSAAQFTGESVAAAVIADTVTLLSNQFSDLGTLQSPFTPDASRTTWYRVAIASGKTLPFKQPSGTSKDYGTDGGIHNFLRYIENWDGQTLNYKGSMVSLYYSAYETGAFKCCTTVYSPPTRNYSFDTNFLTPSLLPPGTPTFKDVVDLGFQQDLNP